MKPEKEVTKIVLHYEDGCVKEIEKGFLCKMTPMEDEMLMSFDMVGLQVGELETIVYGVIELGVKLDMFDRACNE